MRKLISLTITVVTLCVLMTLAPLLIGFYTQTKLDTVIDKVQAANPAIKITIQDYQRHWFSSTARIHVALTGLSAPSQQAMPSPPSPLAFAVNVHVTHGPIFVHKSPAHRFHMGFGWAYLYGVLHLADDSADSVKQWFSKQTLATVGISLGFLGKTRIVAHYLPLTYRNAAQQVTLTSQGANAQWSVNADFSNIEGEHTSKGATFVFDGGKTAITLAQGAQLRLKQHKADADFWVGTLEASIPNATIDVQTSEAKLPVASIDAIDFVHTTRLDDGLLDMNAALNVQSMTEKGHDTHYGPLAIRVGAEHLNVAALNQLLHLSQQLNIVMADMQDNTASMKNAATQQTQLIQQRARVLTLQQQVLATLPQLLKDGAVFAIKQGELKTQNGAINLTASVRFAKQSANDTNVSLMPILNQAAMQLKIAMPKPLLQTLVSYFTAAQLQHLASAQQSSDQKTSAVPAKQPIVSPAQAQAMATALIAHLVKQGVLIEDDAQYSFAFDYQQQQLHLNQQKTTLLTLINKLSSTSAQVMLPAAAAQSTDKK